MQAGCTDACLMFYMMSGGRTAENGDSMLELNVMIGMR